MLKSGKFYVIALAIAAGIIAYFAYNIAAEYERKALLLNAVNESSIGDKLAVDNFIKDLDAIFDIYIERVPQAVESKPKWRVTWNMATGDKAEAEKLISDHFNDEIFNKNDGKASLGDISAKLCYELELNKNSLSLKIGKILGNGKTYSGINSEMTLLREKMNAVFSETKKAIALNLLTSIGSSIIAEELTRMSVTYGVGATFTAVGMTTGSVVPAIGTAIGICVGFASGYAVESYIDAKNNKKIANAIIDALNSSREKIKSDYKNALYKRIENANIEYRLTIEKL